LKTIIITTNETIPPDKEYISTDGAANNNAESKILTKFTAKAPFLSPVAISSKATELAKPIFIPGAIKSNEIRCSINPNTIHSAESTP
jgi:hypothetical protein